MDLRENEYLTLAEQSSGEYKDKGSRFLAYANHISGEESAMEFLAVIKKEHHKARHHCFAFRTGHGDHIVERSSDDGEPSGTAGRPILGQLRSFGLTEATVVVVRYFGGTKLGVSGLIKAYKLAAQDALERAIIVKKALLDRWQVLTDYTCAHHFIDACKKMEIEVSDQNFGHRAEFFIGLPPQDSDKILLRLKSMTLQLPEEMAEEDRSGSWEVRAIQLS